MEDNKFNATVEALFHGMDSVVSSKTVVGDAIHIGDTIILPLVLAHFREIKRKKVPVDLAERCHRVRCL